MNKEKQLDNFRRNELPKYEQELVINSPAQKKYLCNGILHITIESKTGYCC